MSSLAPAIRVQRRALCWATLAWAAVQPVGAAEIFPGPVRAEVMRVIDGDTFTARAHLWPGHELTINVRLRGVDAPEMRATCDGERTLALRAQQALDGLIGGATVTISNIAGAKYYGRVLADVAMEDGRVVAALLIEQDLARPYGGGKREGWCGEG